MSRLTQFLLLLRGDAQADQIVPPNGRSARLTVSVSAAMAFLAVFALALSLAAGRLAKEWSGAMEGTSTVRISAPPVEMDAQIWAVLTILEQTPGVESARALSETEQQDLLEPWFGAEFPIEDIPMPRLVEIVETNDGFDAIGLRNRLAAEAPGAVLDTHQRWREPLARAALRMRVIGLVALLLILGVTAAMVTLAAQAALSANEQVIRVLRLIGARDQYVAKAFVRRFTIRAFSGAVIGTLVGMIAVAFLPASDATASVLTGLRFSGVDWLLPVLVPLLAGLAAYLATRAAAFQTLRGLH